MVKKAAKTVNDKPFDNTQQAPDLRRVADFVPAMIAIYNINTGEYVYVNESVRKLLGYTAKQFIKGGISFVMGLVHPDDLPKILSKNQTALDKVHKAVPNSKEREPIATFEYRMRHKNGNWVWLHTDGSIYDWSEDGKVRHVLNVSIDITKDKESSDRLQLRNEKLQQHARERTERLELALEASKMGIWELDLKTGMPDWSPQAKRLFGLKSSDTVTQEKFISMIHPDDRQLTMDAMQKAIQKNRSDLIEHRVIHPDGSIHWFLTRGKTITEHGAPVKITGIAINIDNLKKTQERLELALQVSKMGTWEWDVVKNKLYWSDELKSIYGLKPSDKVTYERYLKLIHPDDRKKTQAVIQDAMRNGKNYSFEHRIMWRDGSIHWLQGSGKAFIENGKPVRMIGTSVNIDERIEANKNLQESEQRFRTLADTAPVLIWESDPAGHCTYFNEGWLNFTGRTLEQELGLGWEANIHPDDLADLWKIYKKALKSHKPFEQEYRLLRNDGEYRTVLDKGAPRFSQSGQFIGFIGSCVDIEEIKRSERHRRELEIRTTLLQKRHTELVALNKAKDDFISLASHQLRTPATGVKQYLGMVLEGYVGELSEEQKRILQTAYESNERQLKIVSDLLKVAHIDAGKLVLKKQKTDINKLIKDVVEEQKLLFESREQTITIKTKKEKVFANIDPDRMRMVFENVIDNAGKYTPIKKNVFVELTQDAFETCVTVTDQGVGIAKQDISKLFSKFSRIYNELSNVSGGSGLGLYWAQKVVDLHGGNIEVKSKPKQGSTFLIHIPRSK